MTYTKHFSKRQTPQSEPIPGSEQIKNSAGGYVWAVDDWVRLDRFLILGSEGGSYYASERKLTVENAGVVVRCIKSDGLRTVARIIEISEAGRAPQNTSALFALAMCFHTDWASEETRKAAAEALPRVARMGTHLFQWADFMKHFTPIGNRITRRAVANWYNCEPGRLAYQLIKYRQRQGWTHKDILRLAHVAGETPEHKQALAWAVGKGEVDAGIIAGFEKVQRVQTVKEVVALIKEYNLPREAIPYQFLTDASVWEALLYAGKHGMPVGAMIRNLGVMTARGLLVPMSNAANFVCQRMADTDVLKAARLHPIQALAALITYKAKSGGRGSLTWNPVERIVDTLDKLYYDLFPYVEPTHKRRLLALDVSGSMSMGEIASIPRLTPRVGSAALALVTASTETNWHIMGFAHNFIPLDISPRMRLDTVIHNISGIPFGGTDCALPVLYALENGIQVDSFEIYTDNETRAGYIHPAQALQQYRRATGIDAKMVTIGMVSNGFSIADPNDGGMLDVVGFDTATPTLVNEFIGGRV